MIEPELAAGGNRHEIWPEQFLEALHAEKNLHKEHRHRHIIQKLVLSSLFFGFGQFGVGSDLFLLSLYIVPFIAMVHDAYIMCEDFKVKRIGYFVIDLEEKHPGSVTPGELLWEKEWIGSRRDRRGRFASYAYTIIITLFTSVAIIIHNIEHTTNPVAWTVFSAWVLIVLITGCLLHIFGQSIKTEHTQIERKLNIP